jgi:8-oxo-dGTP diphosphatase
MAPSITQIYGNKVRLRVCGFCWDRDKVLLVNHTGITNDGFWGPPGGGVEFGESLEHTLIREFKEETGLTVELGKFMFGCEYINHPLHAVELFFNVTVSGGKLQAGSDPELNIIKDVRFIGSDELGGMNPAALHGIFRITTDPQEFSSLSGFYRI